MNAPRAVDRRPVPVASVGLAALLAYMVLLGGTAIGETNPELQAVGAAIGAWLIAIYVLRGPIEFDRIDAGVLLALVAFALAGVLSAFPRQSFDAVVTALAYAAAFFLARRALASVDARRLLRNVLMALSAVMTGVATFLWLVPIAEWWALTGWSVAPPLNMELGAFPWAHRHDLALLVALLYPAWWLDRPGPLRRAAAFVVGVLGALIVLVDGSRAVWAALGLATIVVAAPWLITQARRHPGVRWAALGLAAGAAVVVVVTGIGGALLERATSLATLDWRAALWGPLIESGLERPIAGTGPGSFVWILPPSGYFDTASWAPRHPDNALIHTWAEAGLLGLLAVGTLVVTLAPALARTSPAVRWVAVVVAVALLGANPSNFAFLVATGIAWFAYGLPRPWVAERAVPRTRGFAAIAGVLLAAIGVAQALASGGALAYDAARTAVRAGELGAARSALETAASLDPGQAIYRRQLGIAALLEGDGGSAVAELARARNLNPSDDLAARAAAMAHDAMGDAPARDAALRDAIDLQRSDAANLLLLARYLAERDPAAAADVLVEVVHAWPLVVHAPGWSELVTPIAPTEEIVRRAFDRWKASEPIPELASDQGVWLTSMTGEDDLAAADSPWPPELTALIGATYVCEAGAIDASSDRGLARSSMYWLLRYRASLASDEPDGMARRMAAIMGSRLTDDLSPGVNPLHEGGMSADAWGYRRPPIAWPEATPPLPAPSLGFGRWFVDPAGAAAEADLVAGGGCGP